MVQLSDPCMTTGKTIALTRWTLVAIVMSLSLSFFFFLSRKNSFIALPGKWEHSGLLPSKLCIPTQVDLVGSFMAMLKGGVADKGQGVCRASGSLLMSFCGPWGYQTVTSLERRMPHQVVNVFVRDFGSLEELKDIMCILWGGTRTLLQGCTIVSDCFSLSLFFNALSRLVIGFLPRSKCL